jgi:hypothetical protein
MASVREWAKIQGFDYRFYDDSFFELVPEKVRPRASEHVCLLTDYARLVAARDLLKHGWDRAIWVDADAVVFDPERFTIPITSSYAFCREIWLQRVTLGKPEFRLTVNNSVSVFCKDQALIDFYLDCADRVLTSPQPLTALSIGTDFLVRLRRTYPFPLLTNVGIFGPEMTYRYLTDDGRYLAPYINYQTSPVYVANLCFSHKSEEIHFSGPKPKNWVFDEKARLAFVERLKAERGSTLNKWFNGSYTPTSEEFNRPLSRITQGRVALRSLANVVKGI